MEEKLGRARYVRRLFDSIAFRYDLANFVITAGRISGWRRRLLREVDLQNAGIVLDLATGTGDLALAIARRSPQARVVGVDLSLEMLRRGREKLKRAGLDSQVSFIIADVTALPFRDGVADGAVNAFMLRHIVPLPGAFTEFRRVLRPGGKLGCLELTQPTRPVFRQVYRLLFRYVTPLLGGLVSGDFEAFRYLPRSLGPYPGAPELSLLLRNAGYDDVRCRLLAGGIVAVHVGEKPRAGGL
ncbi:MAG: ubiquinone/menaquinone biosynthesis methyltransferase [Dehalococcoidia bacterium]|jgi:demethylmenaquinone methyltransferase/2-methoxy-6-polyprenyl-1,4-benzoquinol methylase